LTQFAKRLGHLIREAKAEREKAGESLSDKEIGESLGVSQAHVTYLKNESPKVQDISATLLANACRYFDVDASYFLEEYDGYRTPKRYSATRMRAIEHRLSQLERGELKH
jgi:transcriptional regulator with XRE-family HTH domain